MSDHDDMKLVRRIADPLRANEPVEPSFEIRLDSAVRASVASGEVPWIRADGSPRRRGPLRWLTARRQITVSPFAALAAAGLVAMIVGATQLAGGRGAPTDSMVMSGSIASRPAREVVHFAIVAPGARNVALVGDFNGWDANATPLRSSAANGVWTVTVPLDSGTYQYSFVIDGTKWVADPASAISVEEEFGAASSVLIVRGGSA